MKIYAISDLHLSTTTNKPMHIFGSKWDNHIEQIISDWELKVRENDLVLLGGDFSWGMNFAETTSDFNLLKDLPGKKIMVRGNHDYWWKSIKSLRESVPKNFYLLQNDSIKFDNIIICGSRGWSVSDDNKEDDKKILSRETIRLRLALENAQQKRTENDKLIVLTHFPPFDVKRKDNDITTMFDEFTVDAVIYGHLHGKDSLSTTIFKKNNIPYYLTSCDQVNNKLIEIEL